MTTQLVRVLDHQWVTADHHGDTDQIVAWYARAGVTPPR